MSPSSPTSPPHVLILGGGVTGLCLAYLLARDGTRVTLLEASPCVGGLLACYEPVAGGDPLEHYYHHFFTHDVELLWLLRELRLDGRVEFHPTTMGVFRDGRAHAFDTASDLLHFAPLRPIDRIRFGAGAVLLNRWPGLDRRGDAPALDWLDRWGGRASTDAIWRPLLKSKFGEAAARVPLAWMAGRVRQRARSRTRVRERLGYLRGSLRGLVDALVAELSRSGVTIRTRAPVRELLTEAGRVVGARCDGAEVRGDRVVATIPTTELARLVAPLSPGYAASLAEIEYLAAIVVALVSDRSLSPVYWLNVADAGFDFGGVVEHTRLVPPERYGGRHLVYLSRYLDAGDPLYAMPDDALLPRLLGQLSAISGFDVRPAIGRADVFRARHAATLTDLNFDRRIPAMRSPIDGLFVAAMPHVYPDERSVNNSLRVAAAAKRSLGLAGPTFPPMGKSLAASFGTRPERRAA